MGVGSLGMGTVMEWDRFLLGGSGSHTDPVSVIVDHAFFIVL